MQWRHKFCSTFVAMIKPCVCISYTHSQLSLIMEEALRVRNHDLHNSMILSTLSGLMALVWTSPKGLISMEMYSLLINPWSFPKLANIGLPPNNLQQSFPRTKYTIEPPSRSMEPSNNLPLIETQLLLWSPRTKYTICSTLESLLTTLSRLTTSLFDIWKFYWHG